MSTQSPSCAASPEMEQPEMNKQYFFGNLPQMLSSPKPERDDSDSFSTLLSEQEDADDDDQLQQEQITQSSTRSLSQRWKAMEDRFADRNHAFQQISDKTRNADLLNLLWERERAVRNLERECLLLRHGYSKQELGYLFDGDEDDDSSSSSSSCSDDDEQEDVFYDARMHEHTTTTSSSATTLPMEKTPPPMPFSLMCRSPLHRAAFLEMKTTVPTSINLVFDCLFYASAFEIVDLMMRGVAKHISAAWVGDDEGDEGNLSFVPSILWLLCAFVILWHSGYLFWWSSAEVYNCVKFDLHNQLKLGSWMVQVMRYIREREVLCMAVYMVGYIMAYTSVMMMNEGFYAFLFPGVESNVAVILYDMVTLSISFYVLKSSGFFPWRKF